MIAGSEGTFFLRISCERDVRGGISQRGIWRYSARLLISTTKKSRYNAIGKPQIRTFNLLNGLIPASHFNLLTACFRLYSRHEIVANKLASSESSRAWLKSKGKRFTIGYRHYIEFLYSSFANFATVISISLRPGSSLSTLLRNFIADIDSYLFTQPLVDSFFQFYTRAAERREYNFSFFFSLRRENENKKNNAIWDAWKHATDKCIFGLN